MQKLHKIFIIGIIILAMVNLASASVRPNYVIEVYGIEPAVWLAIAAGIGAAIQHVGRYSIKKRTDPTMTYDMGYLYTTLITILAMCQGIAAIPVTELSIAGIMFYLFSGLGITEGVNKVSKTTKTKYSQQPEEKTPGDTE